MLKDWWAANDFCPIETITPMVMVLLPSTIITKFVFKFAISFPVFVFPLCMHVRMYLHVCICTCKWSFLHHNYNFHRAVIPGHSIQYKVLQIPTGEWEEEHTSSLPILPLPGDSCYWPSHRDTCLERGRFTFSNSLHFLNFTDSLENGKSVQEPLTLNLPQSGTHLWRIPTQTDSEAKRTRWEQQITRGAVSWQDVAGIIVQSLDGTIRVSCVKKKKSNF